VWQLLPRRPQVTRGTESIVAAFNSANINTESHALHHARNNHDWFWFEAPPFSKDVRVFGEIKVQVWLDVDREWVTLTPTVADFDMADHLVAGAQHVGATDPAALVGVTRGWLDSRYRKSLSRQVSIPASGSFGMTIRTKPTDYVFSRGHQVGFNVQTEINEWSIPKPYPCQSAGCPQIAIDWAKARTRLILPVVDPPRDPATLFELGGHAHS
jgi:predicted acyl esterase